MKQIKRYEIVSHGVDNADHFQGCGVSFTEFQDCATGAANSEREALEDALSQLSVDYEISDELAKEVKRADSHDAVNEILREEYPQVEWTVHHVAYCGMVTIDEQFDSESDAREFANGLIAARRKEGFPVTELDSDTWEIEEPENAAMVPDQCGTLMLYSNEEDVQDQIDEIDENANLYYYVSVRVSEEE